MRLIGYYNELGYEIVDIDNNNILYTAGNSPHDSQVVAGREDSLPLNLLKEYCIITLDNMIEDHKAENLGVEYKEFDNPAF